MQVTFFEVERLRTEAGQCSCDPTVFTQSAPGYMLFEHFCHLQVQCDES